MFYTSKKSIAINKQDRRKRELLASDLAGLERTSAEVGTSVKKFISALEDDAANTIPKEMLLQLLRSQSTSSMNLSAHSRNIGAFVRNGVDTSRGGGEQQEMQGMPAAASSAPKKMTLTELWESCIFSTTQAAPTQAQDTLVSANVPVTPMNARAVMYSNSTPVLTLSGADSTPSWIPSIAPSGALSEAPSATPSKSSLAALRNSKRANRVANAASSPQVPTSKPDREENQRLFHPPLKPLPWVHRTGTVRTRTGFQQ
ncbi:hypothetical protein P171DRAFT_506012 [Karstenula rhodostoma CBS 690.94]|uniref:Uncharacterized protein n=1 Tax=Karstenula rhodostoma CBS 690.94 TaxID=1392251 RepID=A0A9P4U479_9PLEO|nr:hypothetical protein P171DRAFT_506012 [Karstenula rhodostoma CBS 690.94]